MNPTPPPDSRRTQPVPPVSPVRPNKETVTPAPDASFDHVMEKIALEMAPDFWSAQEKK